MRIVHVSDCYAPRTGGIETQVAALASRQQASGHDVRVVTATPGPSSAGEVAIDRITARVPFDLPIHPRTRANVAAALRADRPDVVHVHLGAVSPFAWGAMRAVREVGVPAVVTVHSIWGPLARPGYRLADLLTGWASWGARISAVSTVAAALIERAAPGAAPVLVLPNGIDTSLWRPAPFAPVPGELRLVSVLRLAPRKRAIALLRIVDEAAALAPGTRVTLTVVGDGPQRARAERVARRSRAHVRFAGRLDAAGVRAVLAGSDAFVQPSVRESFGIAALEARAVGLPVVARSQSGTAGFIDDGVSGLLADDDRGMAAAIARLAQDPGLLRAIAERNRAIPPAEDWSSVLGLVDAAYGAAMDR